MNRDSKNALVKHFSFVKERRDMGNRIFDAKARDVKPASKEALTDAFKDLKEPVDPSLFPKEEKEK